MRKSKLRAVAAAASGVLALGLIAGCGARDSGTGDDAGGGGGGGGGGAKALTIGYIPWDEDVAVSYLWQHVLEEQGYDVKLQQLDVGPTFAALAQGDIDLFFDTWLPVTHEDYWNRFGDKIEDLGVWYDNASLTIAVPEYVDAQSIPDLTKMVETFDGEIIGIEAGAGLTDATKNSTMPTYNLDEYELVTSSTPAMLAELEQATQAKEPIVVTLWHPHWAYTAYPIKDLEDPKNTLGDAEEIHVVGRQGFSSDFSEIAGWLKDFKMTDEQLSTLEQTVLREYKEDPAAGVDAWVKENQDVVKQMTAGM